MEPMPRAVLGASTPAALRLLGLGLVGLGLVTIALLVVRAVGADLPVVVAGLAVLGAACGAVVVVAAVRLLGRGARLVLGPDGFDNRTSPSVGARRASWSAVQELRVERGLVVLRLDQGRRSVVNPAPLGMTADALAARVRPYLGRALR
jgi:hypothetical protein